MKAKIFTGEEQVTTKAVDVLIRDSDQSWRAVS